jgi:hypothetical protein
MPTLVDVSALRSVGPLSPELAMVDEELRRAACAGAVFARGGAPAEIAHRNLVVVTDRRAPRLSLLLLLAALSAMALALLASAGDGDPRRSESRASISRPAMPSLGRTSDAPAERAAATPRSPVDRAASRRFSWAPVVGATGYRVEFFRDGDGARILARTTSDSGITIPARWSHERRTESLRSGSYRWYVWPVRNGRRSQRAHVQAALIVP